MRTPYWGATHHPAQKSDKRGFVLGLAIADRAIRRHHGTIRAFNLEEGGLSIVITLAAAQGAGQEAEGDGAEAGEENVVDAEFEEIKDEKDEK
ncbi:MAG: hypothetical protein QF705_02130 [Arenicellales bacterium]|nr:hypothetical protein [Arenicellales bacterium]|tara:strand:- start:147 stop:425 length:279 start_codon:yes stop_codon:yes gene_type:complete